MPDSVNDNEKMAPGFTVFMPTDQSKVIVPPIFMIRAPKEGCDHVDLIFADENKEIVCIYGVKCSNIEGIRKALLQEMAKALPAQGEA